MHKQRDANIHKRNRTSPTFKHTSSVSKPWGETDYNRLYPPTPPTPPVPTSPGKALPATATRYQPARQQGHTGGLVRTQTATATALRPERGGAGEAPAPAAPGAPPPHGGAGRPRDNAGAGPGPGRCLRAPGNARRERGRSEARSIPAPTLHHRRRRERAAPPRPEEGGGRGLPGAGIPAAAGPRLTLPQRRPGEPLAAATAPAAPAGDPGRGPSGGGGGAMVGEGRAAPAAAEWPHLLRDGRVAAAAAAPRVAGAERGRRRLGLHVPVEERGPLRAAAAAQRRHLGSERWGEGGGGGSRVPAAGTPPAATRSGRGKGGESGSRPAPSSPRHRHVTPGPWRHPESPPRLLRMSRLASPGNTLTSRRDHPSPWELDRRLGPRLLTAAPPPAAPPGGGAVRREPGEAGGSLVRRAGARRRAEPRVDTAWGGGGWNTECQGACGGVPPPPRPAGPPQRWPQPLRG